MQTQSFNRKIREINKVITHLDSRDTPRPIGWQFAEMIVLMEFKSVKLGHAQQVVVHNLLETIDERIKFCQLQELT